MYASRAIGTLSQVSSVAVLTNPVFPEKIYARNIYHGKILLGEEEEENGEREIKFRNVKGCQERKFYSIFKLFHPPRYIEEILQEFYRLKFAHGNLFEGKSLKKEKKAWMWNNFFKITFSITRSPR